jgi:hypothetical protein
LLSADDFRHYLGWQDDRRAGPSFVIARLTRLSSYRVTERFPMTEDGWASAWQMLRGLDAAAQIAATLAEREARERAAAGMTDLDAASSYSLRSILFIGGSGDVPLVKGQAYDVRFLDHQVLICRHGRVDSIAEVPYAEVDAVEVSGPGRVGMSPAETLALVLVMGMLAAVLGLFVFGLLACVLGGLLAALLGAIIGGSSIKTETLVRVLSRDAELYFRHNALGPDALRVELSGPLRAIRTARAPGRAGPGGLAEPGP